MDDDNAVDLGAFVPEQFKTDDGFDTGAFRAQFDELVTFKTQAEEAKAGLPKGPEEYEFGLPETFELPEGFDPAPLATTNEDGTVTDFDPASMINAEDPDIPALQTLMHRIAQGEVSGVDATKEIAGMLVSRELRAMQDELARAADEKKALGPNSDARLSTIKRTLESSLPAEQAKAVLDGVVSADALRGLETLVKASSKGSTSPATSAPSLRDMTIDERLAYGLSQRKGA